MSARKIETPATPVQKPLTVDERERITVVHALRTPGSIVHRGSLDAITAMSALTTALASTAKVVETFILAGGWTVVAHDPLPPKA